MSRRFGPLGSHVYETKGNLLGGDDNDTALCPALSGMLGVSFLRCPCFEDFKHAALLIWRIHSAHHPA